MFLPLLATLKFCTAQKIKNISEILHESWFSCTELLKSYLNREGSLKTAACSAFASQGFCTVCNRWITVAFVIEIMMLYAESHCEPPFWAWWYNTYSTKANIRRFKYGDTWNQSGGLRHPQDFLFRFVH